MTGIPILAAANRYTMDAQTSDALALEATRDRMKPCNAGKHSPPMVMDIIREEKTQPVGTPPGGDNDNSVGTHMKTNVYIAPSLRACVRPMRQIRESDIVLRQPSIN